MLLFFAFVCFAMLLTAWLAMPEQRESTAPLPEPHLNPDPAAVPARA
ncbi:hypothetical protein BH20CHL3_BH20CHL3_10630 [soil metagenome]